MAENIVAPGKRDAGFNKVQQEEALLVPFARILLNAAALDGESLILKYAIFPLIGI